MHDRRARTVLAGAKPWDQATESQNPKTCNRCHGSISAGEATYCLACCASGHDAPLQSERLWEDAKRHAFLALLHHGVQIQDAANTCGISEDKAKLWAEPQDLEPSPKRPLPKFRPRGLGKREIPQTTQSQTQAR